jgi:hypothetical protein
LAQAQVAFNDNATKLILIGLVQWLLAAGQASRLISVISLLLIAPFVLFAPLTGWLADRYALRDVMSASLWLQLAVMILLCGAAFLWIPRAVIHVAQPIRLRADAISPSCRGVCVVERRIDARTARWGHGGRQHVCGTKCGFQGQHPRTRNHADRAIHSREENSSTARRND